MGRTKCGLHYNSSVKCTFVHLTFNQVVAGSIPARPTNKSIIYDGLEKAVVYENRIVLWIPVSSSF